MTNWLDGKTGLPRRADAAIAKNHLKLDELTLLNRIVTAYLEFAELQALGRQPMTMAAWASKARRLPQAFRPRGACPRGQDQPRAGAGQSQSRVGAIPLEARQRGVGGGGGV